MGPWGKVGPAQHRAYNPLPCNILQQHLVKLLAIVLGCKLVHMGDALSLTIDVCACDSVPHGKCHILDLPEYKRPNSKRS